MRDVQSYRRVTLRLLQQFRHVCIIRSYCYHKINSGGKANSCPICYMRLFRESTKSCVIPASLNLCSLVLQILQIERLTLQLQTQHWSTLTTRRHLCAGHLKRKKGERHQPYFTQ